MRVNSVCCFPDVSPLIFYRRTVYRVSVGAMHVHGEETDVNAIQSV